MLFIYNGVQYDRDDVLSFRDFTGWEFDSRRAMHFEGKVIYASCFSQETPDRAIFRNVTGTTFIRCNLSNVFVPVGAIVIDCQRTRFSLRNDLRDWILSDINQPVEPIAKKYWQRLGYSVDPADIPLTRLTSLEQIRRV